MNNARPEIADIDKPSAQSAPRAARDAPTPVLSAAHRRRLRAIWQSAGWPCQDLIEIEMLAAGWLERRQDHAGRENLRVTDAGIAVLAGTLQQNRRLRGDHEALVGRVATQMLRAGRITWCSLSLRAQPVPGGPWVMAMPDVFSIRNSTVEAYLAPIVHEIKVRRADLLSDLRSPNKRAAYLHLSSECWYVLSEGIAQPDEIPPECGVLISRGETLEVARPAPRRPTVMRLGTWMALARANALPAWRPDDDQPLLAPCTDLGDSAGAHNPALVDNPLEHRAAQAPGEMP